MIALYQRDVDAVVFGAPTYHRDLISPMKTCLFEMEQAGLNGKTGAAFGSYGWSGESIQMMGDTMKHIFGMDVIEHLLDFLLRLEQKAVVEWAAGFFPTERMTSLNRIIKLIEETSEPKEVVDKLLFYRGDEETRGKKADPRFIELA